MKTEDGLKKLNLQKGKQISVKDWYKALAEKIGAFEKNPEHKNFVDKPDGQFQIIHQTLEPGLKIVGVRSISTGPTDAKLGIQIDAVMKKLPDSRLFLDEKHIDSSKELIKIYLEHLKTYVCCIHPYFWSFDIMGANGYGRDLNKVFANMVRDIPLLEEELRKQLITDSKPVLEKSTAQTAQSAVATPTTPVASSAEKQKLAEDPKEKKEEKQKSPKPESSAPIPTPITQEERIEIKEHNYILIYQQLREGLQKIERGYREEIESKRSSHRANIKELASTGFQSDLKRIVNEQTELRKDIHSLQEAINQIANSSKTTQEDKEVMESLLTLAETQTSLFSKDRKYEKDLKDISAFMLLAQENPTEFLKDAYSRRNYFTIETRRDPNQDIPFLKTWIALIQEEEELSQWEALITEKLAAYKKYVDGVTMSAKTFEYFIENYITQIVTDIIQSKSLIKTEIIDSVKNMVEEILKLHDVAYEIGKKGNGLESVANSLTSEISKLLDHKDNGKTPFSGEDSCYLGQLLQKRIDVLQKQIVEKVLKYGNLDKDSQEKVTHFIQSVLKRPELCKSILMKEIDTPIVDALSDKINAAIRDPWFATVTRATPYISLTTLSEDSLLKAIKDKLEPQQVAQTPESTSTMRA